MKSETTMDVTDRLLLHNAWATRVLLEQCRALTPARFSQQFDIGPGSLHNVLRHIIGAMRRWSDRISGRAVRERLEKAPDLHTPDELLIVLEEAARDLQEAVHRVRQEGRYDEMMQTEFSPARFTRGTAIVQVLTHGAHHRAQALNILRRLGVADLPELDAIVWEVATSSSP